MYVCAYYVLTHIVHFYVYTHIFVVGSGAWDFEQTGLRRAVRRTIRKTTGFLMFRRLFRPIVLLFVLSFVSSSICFVAFIVFVTSNSRNFEEPGTYVTTNKQINKWEGFVR